MFASRACRKSIMIGTALNKAEMKKVCIAFHYANTPMQYTVIFYSCKNDNFQIKK